MSGYLSDPQVWMLAVSALITLAGSVSGWRAKRRNERESKPAKKQPEPKAKPKKERPEDPFAQYQRLRIEAERTAREREQERLAAIFGDHRVQTRCIGNLQYGGVFEARAVDPDGNTLYKSDNIADVNLWLERHLTDDEAGWS